MKRVYFTALYPASDMEMKLRKFSIKNKIRNPFPPIVPLRTYNSIINKKDIKFNIDSLPEFNTTNIISENGWILAEIPNIFNKHIKGNIPVTQGERIGFILGLGDKPPLNNNEISGVIRNWNLVFYELILWSDDFTNIELIEHWKTRKKRGLG